MTELLAQTAAQSGWVVVSGLVYGIDLLSHLGALDVQGRTVACLGAALEESDEMYYFGVRMGYLEKGILDAKGTLVTEHPDSQYQSNKAVRILERNRITSILADVVLAVECRKNSGTVDCCIRAFLQGKSVYCLDWNNLKNIDNEYPASVSKEGNMQLVEKGIAEPYPNPACTFDSLQDLRAGFVDFLENRDNSVK